MIRRSLKLRRIALGLAVAAMVAPVAQAKAVDIRPRMEPPCAGVLWPSPTLVLWHSPTLATQRLVIKRCDLPPIRMQARILRPVVLFPPERTPVP